MYALGYDIGSSSIKAALVDLTTRQSVKVTQYPASEMEINSPHAGWAEQDPNLWWEYVQHATKELISGLSEHVIDNIAGIGLSYQMHGLVLLDENGSVLRPSIIWCDSRAVQTGDEALQLLTPEKCFEHLLNAPGNFTAAKFGWVHHNEPEVYQKIKHLILPGDYIAYRFTGQINTTASGLSEGMLWDFVKHEPAKFALEAFGIKEEMIPDVVETFAEQGSVTSAVAQQLGIPAGIPVCYRAGDQPNNAMSLGVLQPGEVAATGGTSGVVYAVMDQLIKDPASRINSFAHVNHHKDQSRVGVLLCINGAGSLYRWIHQVAAAEKTYFQMEAAAEKIPIGADGLMILPFGNGAERMLHNKHTGTQLLNIDLNRHTQAHIYRAALEGIAFAFVYGMEMLEDLGVAIKLMKAGNDNLFQSRIFSTTISNLLQCEIQLLATTGAVGAAKAVAYSLGQTDDLEEAMSGLSIAETIMPDSAEQQALKSAYSRWKAQLEIQLNQLNNE